MREVSQPAMYERGYSGCPLFTEPGTAAKCGVAVELVGTVSPSNYGGPITLRRQFAASTPPGELYYQVPAIQYLPSTFTGAQGPEADDTSPANFLDTTPQGCNGSNCLNHVYDIDAPGIGIGSTANIGPQPPYRYRANFVEYAVLGNLASGASVPTPLPVVSTYFPWWAAVSCTVDPTTGNPILSIDPVNVPGDNKAGMGTTKITWNLQ
jgi:hypothetical protein